MAKAKRIYLYIDTTFVKEDLHASYCTTIQLGCQESMNRGGNAAEAGLAGVVEPAKAEIVHPPNLWGGCHRHVDADGVEIRESIV
jgi:hypothetical protein